MRNIGFPSLVALTLLVGAGGMVGQLVLLRELLVVFYGNELTMGLILSSWLIAEAAGALLGGRKFLVNRALPAYLYLLLLYGVLLPPAIFFSRTLAGIIFAPLWGEALGLGPVFIISMLVVGPISLVHGALFPLATRLCSREAPIGRIYIYETLGTMVGALFFSLYAAGQMDSMDLALAITLIHLGAGSFLLRVGFSSRRALTLLITLTFFLGLIFFPLSSYLEEASLDIYWRDQERKYAGHTPFGNIVLLSRQEQLTYYYDGRPLITVPAPDLAPIQEFVHLVGAAHPRPEEVLFLGGGLGGTIAETLRHPVERGVYVELDPGLIELARRFPTPITRQELEDPRLEIETADARYYLSRTDSEFDVILLGRVSPDTLQTNRLFTGEFFALARACLREGGVLAFVVPGSATYMGPEMANLNASLYNTLQEVFPHTVGIPGDQNIYLASDQPLHISPEVLAGRLQERELYGELWSEPYFEYRLDEERLQWLEKNLAPREVRSNYDFNPAGFYHALSFWGRAFSPASSTVLDFFSRWEPWHYLVLLAGILGLGRLFFSARATLIYAVSSSGGIAMGLDLLVLFVFQCLYGYIYQMAGLLMATFMLGMFLGGRLAVNRQEKVRRTFLSLEITIILSLGLFYGLARLLQWGTGIFPPILTLILLLLFALAGGGFLGAQFPLAAVLHPRGEKGRVAGLIYGADLLGGYVGGLAVAFVLFPLLGLGGTLLFLAGLKVVSLVLLVSRGRRLADD